MKPGYKQTEVGVIPEDWGSERLADLVDPNRTIRYGIVQPGKFDQSGRYMIRGQDYSKGWVHPSEFFKVSAAVETPFQNARVKKGDVLMTIVGASTGRIAIVPEWLDGANLTQTTARIAPRSQHVSGHFLSSVLASPFGQRQVANYIKGNAQPGLNCGDIEKFIVPLPPLAEQEAIATALSDADAHIDSLEQLIVKKRLLKQGAMQDLLTGNQRLPGFEGDWEVKTFGEIFTYLPTATNSRSDLGEEGDAFYIHYGDIHTKFHNHLDFRTTRPPKIARSRCRNAALLKNGDWVMADASEDYDGVGKTIEIQGLDDDTDAIAGLHTFVLREKTPTFAPGFKGHLGNLKSLHEQYLRVATGMKVYGVSKAALRDLELPVPTLPEQTAIAAILSDMNAEIAALEAKLAKARQVKQGMMQELLTGKTRLV
ncbi:MAG: restriction endonuclease subunit S [Verrucomicrobiae bacterium]|nr:restriction endonuclease subunit S [Verrucomicrobiae bacterium]